MKRNSHRPGDWLIVDQLSGVIYYSSETQRDWDGTIRLASDVDGKHPDLVKKPIVRERLPEITNPATRVSAYPGIRPLHVGGLNAVTVSPTTLRPIQVSGSSVLTPVSPADHLFIIE